MVGEKTIVFTMLFAATIWHSKVKNLDVPSPSFASKRFYSRFTPRSFRVSRESESALQKETPGIDLSSFEM